MQRADEFVLKTVVLAGALASPTQIWSNNTGKTLLLTNTLSVVNQGVACRFYWFAGVPGLTTLFEGTSQANAAVATIKEPYIPILPDEIIEVAEGTGNVTVPALLVMHGWFLEIG